MLSLPVYNIGNMSFNQLKKFFIIFCGSEEIYERNIRIQLIKRNYVSLVISHIINI